MSPPRTLHPMNPFGYNLVDSIFFLVCDGASSNLTLLKTLVNRYGAFEHDASKEDVHSVPVKFVNRFSGDNVVIITHQVTRMLNWQLIPY